MFHTTTTVLRPFLRPPGWADARRELLDFMVQRKINRGRHTDHPAGCHSIRTKQCPPPKHWRQLTMMFIEYKTYNCDNHQTLPLSWSHSGRREEGRGMDMNSCSCFPLTVYLCFACFYFLVFVTKSILCVTYLRKSHNLESSQQPLIM